MSHSLIVSSRLSCRIAPAASTSMNHNFGPNQLAFMRCESCDAVSTMGLTHGGPRMRTRSLGSRLGRPRGSL